MDISDKQEFETLLLEKIKDTFKRNNFLYVFNVTFMLIYSLHINSKHM